VSLSVAFIAIFYIYHFDKDENFFILGHTSHKCKVFESTMFHMVD